MGLRMRADDPTTNGDLSRIFAKGIRQTIERGPTVRVFVKSEVMEDDVKVYLNTLVFWLVWA